MEKRNHNMRVEELRKTSESTMRTRVLLLSAFGGWFLYCTLFYSKISNGFFEIYNRLLECWGKYSGTICSFYKTDKDVGSIWFVLAAVWIGCLLVYCLVKRSRKSWRYIWTKLTAVFLTGALAVGFFSVLGLNGTDSLQADGFRSIQHRIDNIRYGTNEKAGLCNGNLYKASGRLSDGETQSEHANSETTNGEAANSETMLEVVMTHPESMYFRGFVGEYYEDGQWTSMENKKKYDSWELFYWLHKSGFYGQAQLGSFAAENGASKENTISVRNISADRRYIYAPYELAACTFLDETVIGDTAIAATGITGEESYQFSAYQGVRTSYTECLHGEVAEHDKSGYELHYRQWVYENYLDIPQEFSKQFESIMEQNAVTTGQVQVSQAKHLILQYLTDYFEYEKQPEISISEDPLIYFLQKSGKGYDVHYASAATLMFRYMGIPARYVEGFLLTEQMADEAGKSTAVSLDAANGHAWTEIYIDGVGWIPFEATPDYRDMVKEAEEITVQSASEAEGQEQGEESSQLPESEEENLSKQEEKPLAGAIRQDDREKEDKMSEWEMVFLIAAVVVFFAIILIIYTILKIRKKRKLFREAINHPNRSLACQNIFSYVMQIAEKKGFRWQGDSIRDNIEQLKTLSSDTYAVEFEKMWFLHEQIRFGGKEPDEKLYIQMKEFLDVSQKMLEKS